MRRREFIAGLGGAVAWPLTRPLAAEAQRRVGALLGGPDPRSQLTLGAFRDRWRRSAGRKAATCGLIMASLVAIPAVSLRMRRNW
jgi:hypothetical protein